MVWLQWCVRAGLSSPRMMNDSRVPPSLAARTLSWPYRLSASTFSQSVYPPSLLFLSAHSTLHLDTSSPPASPSSRILPSSPSAPACFVLFLVYFSHPRTVEMQFASELLLLPPSQPAATSNNWRRSERLIGENCCQQNSENNFTIISIYLYYNMCEDNITDVIRISKRVFPTSSEIFTDDKIFYTCRKRENRP